MGSIEVGQPNKHLSYLNLSKTGLTYKNEGHQDFCEITMDFANSPWLQKQSDYLMSISRFTVPLHEVPIIDTMPAAIEVWPFPHLKDDNTKWESSEFLRNAGDAREPGHDHRDEYDVWANGPYSWNTFFPQWETYRFEGAAIHNAGHPDDLRLVSGAEYSIDLNSCTTVYEWIRMLRDKLRHKMIRLYNKESHLGAWNITQEDVPMSDVLRVTMSPDYKVVLSMNGKLKDQYYVKLSKALFRMCQFKETVFNDGLDLLFNDASWPMSHLPGRRFMVATTDEQLPLILAMKWKDTNQKFGHTGQPTGDAFDDYFYLFEAPVHCADNINRIKRLVFMSDLQVKSEGNTSSMFRRFLVDYVIENPTTINYKLGDKKRWPLSDDTNVTEELPSHRIYTAANPSGGRIQELISDAPLYELTVKCMAQVFDFAAEDRRKSLKMVDIPVSAGSIFSCKVVFFSKNEGSVRPDERDDAPHAKMNLKNMGKK